MFRKIKLDNGMTLVLERMDHVRSVSFGVWVKSGSCVEAEGEGGISHFLEHMFFKGTATRSAEQIAIETDSIGSELNAFTSKEGTTFYIKVLDEYLEKGVEILADIFSNSLFPEDEVEKEKGVIIEEIRMVDDTPDDLVHDIFCSTVWGQGPGLGMPVLGSIETVSSFTREGLMRFVQERYANEETVIACAGSFDEARIIDLVQKKFGTIKRLSRGSSNPRPVFHSETRIVERPLSEAHLCIGLPGIPQTSHDRYGALLLNTALGGGISSRLFQEIREKRGLAYSVYSFLSSYKDAGLWGVYAGTGKENLDEVIGCAMLQWQALPETLSQAELERAKAQVKSSIVLGLESSSRRMQNIANQEIYYGEYFSPDEIIRSVDLVDLQTARALAVKLVKGVTPAVTVLGPVGRIDEARLKCS